MCNVHAFENVGSRGINRQIDKGFMKIDWIFDSLDSITREMITDELLQSVGVKNLHDKAEAVEYIKSACDMDSSAEDVIELVSSL